MSRKEITIPAAGESQTYGLTGCSVIIESANLYESVTDIPTLGFDSGGDKPIYPGAVFNNGRAGFSRLIVSGTAASEGDTVQVYTTNDYLPERIPLALSGLSKKRVGASFYLDSTDAVQQFTEMALADADGNLPGAVYLSARGADVLYSFNADPVQGTDGHSLVAGSEPVKIDGLNYVIAIRFLSAAAATPGTVTVTPEY